MDRRRIAYALLAVAAFVAVAVGVRSCYVENQWEDRVRATQDSVVQAQARIDSLVSVADSATAEADRLAHSAQTLEAQADSIASEAEVRFRDTPERIVQVRVETPADIENHPAVVGRDSIIDDLFLEKEQWREGYEVMAEAVDTLRVSNRNYRSANDSLRTALTVATASVASLNAVLDARPGNDPWWVPEIGVGPSIGLETDGTAYAGVGVNLSWTIPWR